MFMGLSQLTKQFFRFRPKTNIESENGHNFQANTETHPNPNTVVFSAAKKGQKLAMFECLGTKMDF